MSVASCQKILTLVRLARPCLKLERALTGASQLFPLFFWSHFSPPFFRLPSLTPSWYGCRRCRVALSFAVVLWFLSSQPMFGLVVDLSLVFSFALIFSSRILCRPFRFFNREN